MLRLLLLLPTLAMALPQQLTFGTASDKPASIPPLKRDAFVGHQLLDLNDGTFFPSPAFGAGSVWKGLDVTEIVLSALKAGYRHLDEATFYGNSDKVGDAIRQSGIPRDELYLTSKYDHFEGRSVETELQDALSQLGTDYLDLYLIHSPHLIDNVAEVWATFESFVSRGLVRSIGISNYDVPTLTELLALPSLNIPPAVNQIRYHAYNSLEQTPVIKLSHKNDILVAAYSALTPLTTQPGGPIDKIVKEVAEKEDITEGQVLLDWVKGQGIAVVTTSGKEYRQKEQLAVFASKFPRLSRTEVKELNKAGAKGELEK